MSKDTVSTRLTEQQQERLNAFAKDEGLNQSQATEKALDRGLEVYGYGSADPWVGTPPIEYVATEGAKVSLVMAAALGGVHVGTALSMLGAMTVFLTVAIVLLAAREAEPRLSVALFQRGEGA